jgi:phosphate ABC transporter permease protein PstC/phosphate ABC transporter permease subunit PstA
LRALGQAFHGVTALVAAGIVALILAFVYVQTKAAWGSIRHAGLGFLTGQSWDPVHGVYGAVPFVFGTLVTSAIALLLAVPVALGVAILLSELAPNWLRDPLAIAVDLLAAVPSVVYGFWAILVLVPLMQSTVEPALANLNPWFQPLTGGPGPFSGSGTGNDLLTASLVLAIMILPTISAISRESLMAVPRVQRESALSLGATRWEATRRAVLGPAVPGIMAGILLGLGRALGETIAVTLVIGNNNSLPTSLFSPGQTIASLIANDFTATTPANSEYGALLELGLVLLLITILVNVVARLLIWRIRSGRSNPGRWLHRLRRRGEQRRWSEGVGAPLSKEGSEAASTAWRARVQRAAARSRPRRRITYLVVAGLAIGCTVLALVPLVSIVVTAVENGGTAVLRPSFYTQGLPFACVPGPNVTCSVGGVGPQIEGTLVLLGLAALFAVPIGMLAGIYLAEYGRGRFGQTVSFVTDVMTGIPSILIGTFVFVVAVLYAPSILHTLSGWFSPGGSATVNTPTLANTALAGGVALAVLMIPLVTRTTEEALRTVPVGVRESALALGFPRHWVTLRVAIGSARGAIITGTLLAAARAGGETAAILVTTGAFQFWPQGLTQPIGALPLVIFQAGQFGYPNWQADAWGAALILLMILLVLNIVTRLVFRRTAGLAEAG